MRARIVEDGGCVVLQYLDSDGHLVVRRFTAQDGRGRSRYVFELRSDGSTTQPCGGLSRYGRTLEVSNRAELLPLIRREFRVMRRSESK